MFRYAQIAKNFTLNKRHRDMPEASSSKYKYVGEVIEQFKIGISGICLNNLKKIILELMRHRRLTMQ